jgi:hypothetical protein
MSWEVVGPESGIFAFPAVNDLVLIACADGDEELAFVIRRLTSKEDKIPLQAATGDTAIVSLNGKKTWISSNTRINLSKGSTEPTENLVLGQVLKTLLSDVLTELSSLAQTVSTHTHIGNLGFPTAPPLQSAAIVASKTVFDNKKANPVNNNGILSSVAYTEKG